VLGHRPDPWRCTECSLAEHDIRRLNGYDTTIRRLVGARPGAHVHDGSRATKRSLDRQSPRGVGSPTDGVAKPDLVVGGSRRCQITDVGAEGTGGQVSPPMPGMRPIAFLFRSPITLETATAASPATSRRSKSRFTMSPPYRG
jgi:hypothetical protein